MYNKPKRKPPTGILPYGNTGLQQRRTHGSLPQLIHPSHCRLMSDITVSWNISGTEISRLRKEPRPPVPPRPEHAFRRSDLVDRCSENVLIALPIRLNLLEKRETVIEKLRSSNIHHIQISRDLQAAHAHCEILYYW
jgi:hypothetical protein